MCNQFEFYWKSFHKILRDNCVCDSSECESFTPGFDSNVGKTKCECSNCSTCPMKNLDLHYTTFLKHMVCARVPTFVGSFFPSWTCINQECTDCKFHGFTPKFLSKFCPNFDWKTLNRAKIIKVKQWDFVEMISRKGCKYKVHYLENNEITIEEFFQIFEKFLIEKRGFVWHHYKRHWQKNTYNQIIKNCKDNISGDSLYFAVVDNAEDWKMHASLKECANQ